MPFALRRRGNFARSRRIEGLRTQPERVEGERLSAQRISLVRDGRGKPKAFCYTITNDINVVSLSLRATNGSVAISPLLGLLQSLRSFAMTPYLMRLY